MLVKVACRYGSLLLRENRWTVLLKAVGGLRVSVGLQLRANRTKGKLTRKHGAGGGNGERSRRSVIGGAHRILILWITKQDISEYNNINLTSFLAGVISG